MPARESQTIESSTVKRVTPFVASLTNDPQTNMKLSVVVLFAFLAVLLSADYAKADVCPPENCVESSQCDSVNSGATCENGATCCSLLKREFRTHCRHHGGECMKACSTALHRYAVDCGPDEVCCVLV